MPIPPVGQLAILRFNQPRSFPTHKPTSHLYYHQSKLLLSSQAMDLSPLHPSGQYLYPSHLLFPYQFTPENYVHWTQTPESHVFSADLPGVRKEEIKVEVEDSRYLIIRTEAIDETSVPAKSFMKKFRLPGRVDIDGISAGYEHGVLTITVPRSFRRRGLYIDLANQPAQPEVVARAA